MLLFVLAADPFLRWIRFKASSHIDRMFAYADDFCFGLRCLFDGVGPLFHCLQMLNRAIGLALNFPKCQVVIVYARLREPLQDFLEALGSPFPLIEITMCLKYLGVWIGIGAAEIAFNETTVKLQKRTREIRDLGLGLAQSIVLFKTFCVSLLYFMLQLHRPTRGLDKVYQSCVRLLSAGPNNALSYDMCTNLCALGLPVEFPRLSLIAEATRARYIARCDELPRLRSQRAQIFEDDDWCPYRRCTGPYVDSFLTHLYAFQDEIQNRGFTILFERKDVQKQYSKALKRYHQPAVTPHEALLRRASAWIPGVSIEDIGRVCAVVKKLARRSSMYIPLANIRMLSRCVCTSARFHAAPRGCILGCPGSPSSLNDLDDMLHYLVCPRLQQLFSQWMGSWTPLAPRSSGSPEGSPWLHSFLLFRGLGPDQCLLSSMLCDAFLSMHSSVRYRLAGTPAQQFEARLRMQSRRHRACRRVWSALDLIPGWEQRR